MCGFRANRSLGFGSLALVFDPKNKNVRYISSKIYQYVPKPKAKYPKPKTSPP
jgi:hypothetical protein